MRHSISIILAMLFVFLTACAACAEPLEVTNTPGSVTAARGHPVAMAVNLKNALSPREPVMVTAEAEWEDEYGMARTTISSTTLNFVQPVKLNRYKVALPALFGFVAGSARVDGELATPSMDSGQLVFDIDRTLLEGQSVALEYALKAE